MEIKAIPNKIHPQTGVPHMTPNITTQAIMEGTDNIKLNKTLDDIFVLQIYGKRDPKEKNVPFESKNAKFFERILHPMQYGSLRGSIFGLSSMCLEAGSMVLAIRCKQFGMVNFLIFLILGGVVAYWCLVKIGRASCRERV